MKWLNATLLWMGVSVGLYALAMHGVIPAVKYYPEAGGVFRFYQKPNLIPAEEQDADLKEGSTKFSNTAVFWMAVALPAMLVGLILPQKLSPAVHLLSWAMLLVSSGFMIHREVHWFMG
jgi:hypothetical protein